jgi:DNA ligase D-like protein (predicted 3'-phosphoesterase)
MAEKADHGGREGGGQQGGRQEDGRQQDGRLAEYRRRRDFSRTAEPSPGGEPAGGDEPVFVVQLHDASSLHFDFRLEVDGALKSWAVPKGPSADPHDKRLAMPTEDHPMEYRTFEGVIAEGEYGAGTVIVWDEGGYRNLSRDRSGREIPFAEALRAGHASFRLDGAKLHGGYALTRFRDGSDGSGEAWLLVKREESAKGAGKGGPSAKPGKETRASKAPKASKTSKTSKASKGGGAPADPSRARSVRTGRTLKQVAAGESP